MKVKEVLMLGFDKKKMYEFFSTKKINELPYYLSRVETKIYRRVGLGEGYKVRSLRNLKYLRNFLRKFLLYRLLGWFNDKGYDNLPDVTFYDVRKEKELKRLSDGMSGGERFRQLLKELGIDDDKEDD